MQRRAFLQTVSVGAATLLGGPVFGADLPPLQRGVALGLFSEDPLWSYGDLLREIRDLGATHVALTVAYYQQHAASTAIYAHPRFTAPDLTLIRTLREAKALGLKSMVFPIIRLEHPRSEKEWRGTLAPSDANAWWQSYESLLLRVARLSSQEGAALLSVGSEQSTLDLAPQKPHWQRLIERVRKEFRGLLTYSGNWDHYQDVAIYDLVDLAGMCAYFPLAKRDYTPPADVALLVEAWQKKRAELEQFASRVGKPLLLTEVGYLSQRGAAAWPWEEGASEPTDLEDQRRCYQAFAEVWRGSDKLRGVYFWNYYGWGGLASRGYTPRHKPAGQEIERYFAHEAARPAL